MANDARYAHQLYLDERAAARGYQTISDYLRNEEEERRRRAEEAAALQRAQAEAQQNIISATQMNQYLHAPGGPGQEMLRQRAEAMKTYSNAPYSGQYIEQDLQRRQQTPSYQPNPVLMGNRLASDINSGQPVKRFANAAAEGEYYTQNMSDKERKAYEQFNQYRQKAQEAAQAKGHATIDWDNPFTYQSGQTRNEAETRARAYATHLQQVLGIDARTLMQNADYLEAAQNGTVTKEDLNRSPYVKKQLENLAYLRQDAQTVRKGEDAVARFPAGGKTDLQGARAYQDALQEFKEKHPGWTDEQIESAMGALSRTQVEEHNHAVNSIASLSDEQADLLGRIMEPREISRRYNGAGGPMALVTGRGQIGWNPRNAEEYQAFVDSFGGDIDTAERYIQYAAELQDETVRGEHQELIRSWTQDGPLAKRVLASIGLTAYDVAASPIAGYGGIEETFRSRRYADPLAPVNTNSAANELSAMSSDIEQTIGENFGDSVGGKIARFAYNVGTSTAKSMYSAAIGQGIGSALGMGGQLGEKAIRVVQNAVTLPSFGAGAYSQTLEEAQKRGITGTDAILTAAVSGMAEMATEIVSLDKVWDIMSSKGVKAAKNVIADAIVQAGIEGSEEVASDLINLTADSIINADKSEYNQTVRQLMAQGMSEEEAKRQATKQVLAEIASDFLAGSASGGASGMGANVGRVAAGNTNSREMFSNGYEGAAETFAPYLNSTNEEIAKYAKEGTELANRLEEKQKNGEKIKAGERRRLYNLVNEVTGADVAAASDTRAFNRTVDAYAEQLAREKAGPEAYDQMSEKEQQKAMRAERKEARGHALREYRDTMSEFAQAQNERREALKNNSEENLYDRPAYGPASVPENYRTQVTEATSSEVSQKITEAKTAEDLVAARNEGLNSTVQNVPAMAERLYRVKSEQLIKDGTITRADLRAAEKAPTNQDLYLMGANEQEASGLTEAQQVVYNEGVMRRQNDQASLRLRSNEEVRGRIVEVGENAKVQTDQGVQDASAYMPESDAGQRLYKHALNMDTAAAANLYLETLPEGAPVASHERYFDEMYNVGRIGARTFEQAIKGREWLVNKYGKETLQRIYDQGRKDAGRTEEETTGPVKQKGSGKVLNREAAMKDSTLRAMLPFAEAVAKKTGLDIEMNDELASNIQGEFNRTLSKIVLNVNSNSGYSTLFHELGEFIKAYDQKAYTDLRNAILDYWYETEGNQSANARALAMRDIYRRAAAKNKALASEANKTIEDAADELINDAISGVFATEKSLKAFTDYLAEQGPKGRTLLQKFADFFKTLAEMLRNLASGNLLSNTSAKSLARAGADRANQIRQAFLSGLESATQKYQQTEVGQPARLDGPEQIDTEKQAAPGDKISYSIGTNDKGQHTLKYDYGDGTEYVLDDEAYSFQVNLQSHIGEIISAETRSEILGSVREFYRPYQKGTANKDNYFGATIAEFQPIKYRPRRKPDYVSTNRRTGKISSEYWYTDEGVIRGSNHWGAGIASCDWFLGNQATNMGGHKQYGFAAWGDFVQKTQIDTNRDLKRAQITTFENTVSIERAGLGLVNIRTKFADSVSHSLSADSTGRELTPGQREYFKDSKVVDENGRLKVMYHGTHNGGFTIFDPRYSDDGRSLFFSDSLETARSYSNGSPEVLALDRDFSVDELEALVDFVGYGDIEMREDNGEYVLDEYNFSGGMDEIARGSLNQIRDYLVDRIQDTFPSGSMNINYPVYLNITNPLVVEGGGRSWDDIGSLSDAKNHWVYAELANQAGDDLWEIRYDGTVRDGGYEEDTTRTFTTEELRREFGKEGALLLMNGDPVHNLYIDDQGNQMPSTTRDWAEIAYEQGHDGVIFNDIWDGGEEPSQVVVAFSPEQVKSTHNENPTEDPDIRYSIGEALGEGSRIETDSDGNFQLAVDKSGDTIVTNLNDVSYSLATMPETQRKLQRELERMGFSKEEITDELDRMERLAELVQDVAAGYDEMGQALRAEIITDITGQRQVLRSLLKNGEYPVNIDFMTICKKRQAYAQVLSDLIDDGLFSSVNLDADAIADINDILRDYKYETACLGCFVESRRLQVQKWAESFVDAWNEEVKNALGGREAKAFNFGRNKKGTTSLSGEEIEQLIKEHEQQKLNEKGNVKMRSGMTVRAKMAELLRRVPSLARTLEVGDVVKANGVANLRSHYGDIYSLLLQWYGSNTPKVTQDFNPYNGEFADLSYGFMKKDVREALTGSKKYKAWAKEQLIRENGKNYKPGSAEIESRALQKYLFDIGGARAQSFSDFLIENTLDYFQMVADLKARQFPMHAYSKELSFHRIFGMTGMKTNMSLIPVVNPEAGKEMAGLNPDGSYAGWGDYERHVMLKGQSFIQSIGWKDAIALQLDPRYSGNVGTIAIGISDAHIRKMLSDPLIRMIIPYHSSGMNPNFAKRMNIDLYNDYTDYQNTTVKEYRDRNGNVVEGFGKKAKVDMTFDFNEAARRLGDARAAAAEYIAWCAKEHPVMLNGKKVGTAVFTPKFEQFTDHENYYKLLEDFNMYDAITEEAAPQMAVDTVYPDANHQLTAQQLKEYEDRLRETGEFTEKDIQKYVKKAQMSLEDIIREETKSRNAYRREADANYGKAYKAISDMLGEKYERERQDIRYSVGENAAENVKRHDYSYDTLVQKDDIQVHTPAEYGFEVIPWSKGVKRSDLLKAARRSIQKYNDLHGRHLGGGKLYNKDLGAVVSIPNSGLKHGLTKMRKADFTAVTAIPAYFESAIVINELSGEREKADNAFVLVGYYKGDDGGHIVRMVVNHYNNSYNVEEIHDVLYGLRSKKEEAVPTGTRSQSTTPPRTSSTITIARLLDAVKKAFPNEMSEDVATHFGYARRESELTGLQYSIRDEDLGVFSGDDRYSSWRNEEDVTFNADGSEKRSASFVQQSFGRATSLIEEGTKILLDQIESGQMTPQQLLSSEQTARKIARKLLHDYQSGYDQDTLRQNLQSVFGYLEQGQGVNYEELVQLMMEVAEPVLSKAKETTVGQEVYDSFRKNLSTKSVRLNEQQKEEVAYYYGSYGAFRNAMRGVINISNKATSTLDMVWEELVESAQGVLDPDVSDAQMPLALADAVEALRPQAVSTFGGNSQDMAYDMALDIIGQYFAVRQEAAVQAEKKAAGAKARQRYSSRLAKVRERLAAEKKAYREKVQARYNERLQKAREELKGKRALWEDKYHDAIRMRDEKLAEMAAKNRNTMREQRDRRLASQEREQIRKIGKELIDTLNNPTDKKHIPQGMRQPISEFLSAIDFLPARAQEGSRPTRAWQERMRSLQTILNNIASKNGVVDDDMSAFEYTLDPDIAATLNSFLERNGGLAKLSDLNYEGVHELKQMLTAIRAAVSNANKMIASEHEERVSDLANGTFEDLAKRKDEKDRTGVGRFFHNLLHVSLLDSFSYFEGLGKSANKVYRAIRDGFDRRAKHLKDAQEWFAEASKGFSRKDFQNMMNTRRTFKGIDGEVSLSVSQIMSLYELMKRQQARDHITLGGIKSETYKEKGKTIEQKRPVHFSKTQLQEMFDTLTDEQKALADRMQEFMGKEAGSWGNRVTMAMYGYEKFGEEHYFPIKTDKNSLAVTDRTEQNDSVQAIRNMSASKETVKGARNALMIGDIFEVFSNHVADMATYDGFVMPLADAMRWFNYKFKYTTNEGGSKFDITRSVQEEISRVMGSYGRQYFTNLMKDINGMTSAGHDSQFGDTLLSNFKAAAVGANLRVAVQQPTAYMRAMAMMNPKYLLAAMPGAVNPRTLIHYAKKANQNSMIAWWKSQGYFETNLGKTNTQIITGQATMNERIREASAKLAELGDTTTWGTIYHAVELEQKAAFKKAGKSWYTMEDGKRQETAEFTRAVVARFNDIIDHTQVVDSVLHRSQFMRSKNGLVKLEAAFQSEPTKSFNMLFRAFSTKKGRARIVATFAITNLLTAAVASAADAFRYNDDDDKSWLERWMEALFGVTGEEEGWYKKMLAVLTGNLGDQENPFGLIPYVKDAFSVMGGFDSTRSDLVGIENSVKAVQEVLKFASGDSKKTPYGLIKALSQGFSQLTGVPAYAALREFETGWNTLGDIFGFAHLQTKIESSARKRDYGRLYDAINKGGDITGTVQQLILDGKNVKDIRSAITTEYKDAWKEAEDKSQIEESVTAALQAMSMSEDEIQTFFAGWGKETVTYAALDDAIDAGGDVAAAVQEMLDGGKTPKAITSHLQNAYAGQLRALNDISPEAAEDLKNDLTGALQAAGAEDPAGIVAGWASGEVTATSASVSEYAGMKDAISSGGDVRGEVDKLLSSGKDGKTVKTTITRAYKDEMIELYKTDKAAATELKQKLISAYMAAGDTRDEANERINSWVKG